MPQDYGYDALNDPNTRALMEKIELVHGGPEFDSKYPDGIPTDIQIRTTYGESLDSGLVMYPSGHARNETCDLEGILDNKFNQLGSLAMNENDLSSFLDKLNNIEELTNSELKNLYNCQINYTSKSIDEEGWKL